MSPNAYSFIYIFIYLFAYLFIILRMHVWTRVLVLASDRDTPLPPLLKIPESKLTVFNHFD